MRISRDQLICGVPAFDLRAALKKMSQGWNVSTLAARLNVSKREATAILEELLSEGFVEPDPVAGRTYYQLTIKGGALAGASALKPIRRQRATELLEELVGRAREVNADARELYRVSTLWVFGSYLTGVDALGDVDVAVELTRKDGEWPPIPKGEQHYWDVVPPPRGRRAGYYSVLAWPYDAVMRRLKGRERYLSLVDHRDDVLTTARKKELFVA